MGKIQAPPFKKKLTTVFLGGIDFPIYYGRPETLAYVNRVYAQDILLACASVTGGTIGIQVEDATRIVQSALQIEWYKAREKEVPESLQRNLEKFVEDAKARPVGSASGGGKRGSLKIKDIIIDGLLQNRPENEIIQTVHEQFPEARTGPRDLAFYRHKLRKSGDLPPPQKRERKQTSRKETTMANEKEVAAPEPRATRTIDLLKQAKSEGWEPATLAAKMHEVLDGRPNENKVIKDVIILGILDGDPTEVIVKNVHETFKDVPSVTPKTGAKDVAYYRTRLRKDWNLNIPTTRSVGGDKPAVEEANLEGGDEADAEAKPTKARRKKGADGTTEEKPLDA